jgi:glycosyltransferase involved in cell wall biosynthesis
MNVAFCRWLSSRKEEIDLMVHEPGLGFGEGGLTHNAVAAVHRLMAAILLKSATRVWVSTSAWEARLRPYAFGRPVPFEWLPVPSNIPVVPAGADRNYAVGYFGQYDRSSIATLMKILDATPESILLMGRGAERVPMHARTIVAGEMDPWRFSRAISSCQVMCHIYPDGVSGRRGTVMASLSHGRPVVTVEGRFTEPLWRESGALKLSPAGDAAGLTANISALLRDHDERSRMSRAAMELYQRHFSVDCTIARLLA